MPTWDGYPESRRSPARKADKLVKAACTLEGQSEATGAADTGGLDSPAGFSHNPVNPIHCARDSSTRSEERETTVLLEG